MVDDLHRQRAGGGGGRGAVVGDAEGDGVGGLGCTGLVLLCLERVGVADVGLGRRTRWTRHHRDAGDLQRAFAGVDAC